MARIVVAIATMCVHFIAYFFLLLYTSLMESPHLTPPHIILYTGASECRPQGGGCPASADDGD